MPCYSLSQLTDQAVLQGLDTLDARDLATKAPLLAHVAEVDERKLYVPMGYPSMFAYCVKGRRWSDDVAAKRIQAARVARRFPAIFPAVAEGRLHLTAVVLLAPHLTEDTAAALLSAATHKTKSEIEQMLAARFPQTDLLAWSTGPSLSRSEDGHAPGHVGGESALAHVETEHAPGHVDRSRVQPLSHDSFGVQFTLGRADHDKLRYAQELLSHQIPSGDIAAVFVRALDALIPQIEKASFAATEKPRPVRRSATPGSRNIPAHVRRSVRERDDGRCTFVSESGHRCEARTRLEFDHIEVFARGGETTVDNVRLLCRAHNQYEAERTFGPEFMRHKRLAAAEARAAAKAQAKKVREQEAAAARARAAEKQAHELEVVPYLRQLGYNARESRDAAALCRDMKNASLEERVRVALSYFQVRCTRKVPAFVPAMSTNGGVAIAAGP